jgi:DNA-binding transcriptional ArsR family regulator
VTITFHIAGVDPGDISFAYSPVLEAVLSLHVLTEPKHHPLQHPFIRDMQVLPVALRRDIERFRFVYAGYFPAFVFPSASGVFHGFEAELDALADVDEDLARVEYTEMFAGDELRRDPALRREPAAQERILSEARRHRVEADVARALADPAGFHGEFLAFLRRYWEAAFEREWDRTEPVLAGAVADAGRRLARGGIFDVLSLLWPAVRVDRQEGCFSLDRSHEHDVDVTSHRRLTLSPSAFVWPHVRVNCDDPWPLAVVIPALQLLDDVSPRIPPQELLEVLRALAHDVRLSVLRLVMERPRSTQELAGLVGMSEAALNRHLRHLAAVGLVRSERDGYYVLYSARADRLTAVGPALARFLGEPARRSSD